MCNVKSLPKGEFVKQVDEILFPVNGALGSELIRGHDLAVEFLGEGATAIGSDMVAFAYLWRRFGPPWAGGDSHKTLATYYLTTPDPDVFLWLSLGTSLALSIGYLIERGLDQETRQARAEWWRNFELWVVRRNPDEATQGAWLSDNAKIAEAKLDLGDIPLREPADWRLGSAIRIRVNEALIATLRDLMRPVYIRDVGINILGRKQHEDPIDKAEPSVYAGYGVPKEAMDKWIESSKDA
jgi:hypothetical protein